MKSGRGLKHRFVKAVERRLFRARLHARQVEHALQGDAGPARVAHQAVPRLAAGDARLEKSATVARTLIDSDQFDLGHRLEVGERKLQRTVDLALDLQRERIGIDRQRNVGKVVAHEKCVIRRDDALVEHREWRLELRRPRRQPKQLALLRVLHERPFAVGERQRRGLLRQSLRLSRKGAADERRRAALNKPPSIQHEPLAPQQFRRAKHRGCEDERQSVAPPRAVNPPPQPRKRGDRRQPPRRLSPR